MPTKKSKPLKYSKQKANEFWEKIVTQQKRHFNEINEIRKHVNLNNSLQNKELSVSILRDIKFKS